jgi:TonB family protein
LIILALLSLIHLRAQEKRQESNDKPQDGTQEKTAPRAKIPPRVTHAPNPKYSREGRNNRIQGIVVLHLLLKKDGRPENISVIRGLGYGLDEEAINVVKNKWRFDPAKLADGTPVDVQINVEVSFRLY